MKELICSANELNTTPKLWPWIPCRPTIKKSGE